MKHRTLLFLWLLVAGPSPVHAADDLNNLGSLDQAGFRLLSKDLGPALGYAALTPGDSLRVAGMDVGLSITGASLRHPELWQTATASASASGRLLTPKLQVAKDLPAGFDVGAFVSTVSDTSLQLLGGELGYSITDDAIASPLLSLRGTFSRLSGSDQLVLDTTGIELSIAGGMSVFTPYAGIGRTWTDAGPASGTGLRSETILQNKYFLGANMNLMLFNLSLEVDDTDDVTSYNSRLGVRF